MIQLKKLQDKVEKCRADVENSKARFEAALNDINGYNAKYMEEMAEVSRRGQMLMVVIMLRLSLESLF